MAANWLDLVTVCSVAGAVLAYLTGVRLGDVHIRRAALWILAVVVAAAVELQVLSEAGVW